MSLARRAIAYLPRKLGYHWGPRLMSRLRKLWVRLRNPHVDIRFGKYVYLGPGFSLDAPLGGTLIVGDLVQFRRGIRVELARPEARVTIGNGSYFTYDVVIACSTSIEIGERCGLGQATFVVDGNHRFRDLTRPMLEQGYDFRPIKIGDDVSITNKCTIIADIGERCYIGANSVVTKPLPPFTVAAGVPARVIDYFGPEEARPPGLELRSTGADGEG
jgi:acetyltransferase-like isoleucine patch superfamily enzyme